MKQTAVEYLFEQLWETPKDKFNWYSILEKVKEMEKQQIINTFKHAQVLYALKDQIRAEQYYNETYKSE
jgi:hypothetical protein